MPTTLLETLEQIKTLAQGAKPETQDYLLQQLQALKERLESEESDRIWDELLASPESDAFLDRLEEQLDREIAAGTTREGGWSLS
jgi:hypothetical protein